MEGFLFWLSFCTNSEVLSHYFKKIAKLNFGEINVSTELACCLVGCLSMIDFYCHFAFLYKKR